MPLLFSEAICAPDRLTRADVISNPEVRSALSLAASTARATPSRLTTPPLLHPERRHDSHADDAQARLLIQLAHQGADLGRPDVDTDENDFL